MQKQLANLEMTPAHSNMKRSISILNQTSCFQKLNKALTVVETVFYMIGNLQ